MSALATPFYQSGTNIQIAPADNCYVDVNAFGTSRWKHRYLNDAANPDQEIRFNQNDCRIMQGGGDVMVFDQANTRVQLTRPLELGSQQIKLVADGTDAQDVSTKNQLDTGLALKYDATTSLDQITAAAAALDLNAQKITNLAAPTVDSDATTKLYVDNAISGVSAGDGAKFVQMSKSADTNTAGSPSGFWSPDFDQVDYHKGWAAGLTVATSTHNGKTHYRYALTAGKVYKFKLSMLNTMSVLNSSIAWLFRAIFVPDSEDPVTGTHDTVATFYFDRRNFDDTGIVRQNDVEFLYSPSAAGSIKFIFPDDGSGAVQNISGIKAGCRLIVQEY